MPGYLVAVPGFLTSTLLRLIAGATEGALTAFARSEDRTKALRSGFHMQLASRSIEGAGGDLGEAHHY